MCSNTLQRSSTEIIFRTSYLNHDSEKNGAYILFCSHAWNKIDEILASPPTTSAAALYVYYLMQDNLTKLPNNLQNDPTANRQMPSDEEMKNFNPEMLAKL